MKSDAIALATMVDEVVLDLRAGRTTHEEAQLARQYLDSVHSNVVGVILNAVDALAWLYGDEMNDPQHGLAILTEYESSCGQPDSELLDTYGTLLFCARRFDGASKKLNETLGKCGQSADRASALFQLPLVQYEIGAQQEAATNLRVALQYNHRIGGLTSRQVEEGGRLPKGNISSR